MNCFKNKIVNLLWELLPGFTLWEIWKTRNRQTFENKSRKQGEIRSSIEAHLKETITLHQWTQEEFIVEANERIILYDLGIEELPSNNSISCSVLVSVSSSNSWIGPLAGSFKLNVDGATKGNPGPTSYGGAIRNSKGDMLSLF